MGRPVSASPRLRPDLTIVEQTYRGEQSFIVKDPKTRKYFRFRPVEVSVLRAFDGSRTAADVAAGLTESGLRVSAGAVEGYVRPWRAFASSAAFLATAASLLRHPTSVHTRYIPLGSANQ